jgi:aspartate aminotransferase-like enzyme
MLPPGMSLKRRQREGAAGLGRRGPAQVVLGLAAHPRGQPERLLPLHATHQPAVWAEGVAGDASWTASTCRSAPALSKLAGRVFRIGHLGHFNDLTLAGSLAGVQMGLQLADVPIDPSGVSAALELLRA